MEGGEEVFQPVSISDFEEALQESDYSAELSAPEYTETGFSGPGLNWTGDGTYITEASLVLTGAGPEIKINFSAGQERMWYDIPSRAYQDRAREALQYFANEFSPADEEVSEYCWSDFAGYDDVKESIKRDVVWPIENPQLFDDLGVETSHVLLYGPPGTGKTLLGNVIADETDSSFYQVRIGDVVNSLVGESEEYIQDLFEEARENSPAILFIDELDALGRDREEQTTSTSKNIVNTFLSELDGLNGNGGVTAIGTTNKPDDLDSAFTRPGRFSRDYEIGKPDEESRREIFQVHLEEPGEQKGVPAVENIDYEILARETPGATGAAVKELVEEAAKQKLLGLMQDEEISDIRQVNFQNYEESLRLKAEDILDIA